MAADPSPQAQATPEAPAGEGAPSEEGESPEAVAKYRVDQLKLELTTLQREIYNIEGRIRNRMSERVKQLEPENQALEKRLENLFFAFFSLMTDRTKPRTEEQFDENIVVLQQRTIQYFKYLNLDPDKWKDIEF